tara:strand:+ start:262 stop:498 length:237 start_codon:yes stop_codon:yes gene_type:complete
LDDFFFNHNYSEVFGVSVLGVEAFAFGAGASFLTTGVGAGVETGAGVGTGVPFSAAKAASNASAVTPESIELEGIAID